MSIRSLSILLLGSLSVVACNRDAAANPPAARDGASAAPDQHSGTPEPKNQHDEGAFSLRLAPRTIGERGQAGQLAIVLTAKAPFHVNQEYPHRFKVTDARGLTTPSNVIGKDAAKLSHSQLDMTVPVTLSQEGSYRLEGEMSFSVCTDEKCLVEKRTLVAEFTAK